MAGKGGARPGAGRKSNAQKMLEEKDAILALSQWCTPTFQKSKLQTLLNSEDENVQLKALTYVMDRMYGKPRQAMEHTGKDGAALQFTITRSGAKEK